MNITTRLFKLEDLELCAKLFVDVFNQEPWNDEWTVELASDYFRDVINTPGFYGFVVEQNSSILGFILGTRKRWWSGDIYYLYEMCVNPEAQGKGIGTKLLEDTKNWLYKNQFSSIVLLTERTFPSAQFYKKQGFIESPETRFYLYPL